MNADCDTEQDFPSAEMFAFHGQREQAAQTANGEILELGKPDSAQSFVPTARVLTV